MGIKLLRDFLTFQYADFEDTWRSLLLKHVVRIKLDVYVSVNGDINLHLYQLD